MVANNICPFPFCIWPQPVLLLNYGNSITIPLPLQTTFHLSFCKTNKPQNVISVTTTWFDENLFGSVPLSACWLSAKPFKGQRIAEESKKAKLFFGFIVQVHGRAGHFQSQKPSELNFEFPERCCWSWWRRVWRRSTRNWCWEELSPLLRRCSPIGW